MRKIFLGLVSTLLCLGSGAAAQNIDFDSELLEAKAFIESKDLDTSSVKIDSVLYSEGKEVVLDNGEIFAAVEDDPQFPGGMAELSKFLRDNIIYPVECQNQGIQGRVIVQFVVNADGSIVDANVVKSVDPLLDREALRVIGIMPKWQPGKQRGKPVRVRFTLPVIFRLAEENPKHVQNTQENKADSITSNERDSSIIEEDPMFPGGMQVLMMYLKTNIKYPKEAFKKRIQGRVIVQFVVNKDGSITDIKIVNPVNPHLDKEALRLVKSMPKWIPGKRNGEPVNVRFTLPINFRLGEK